MQVFSKNFYNYAPLKTSPPDGRFRLVVAIYLRYTQIRYNFIKMKFRYTLISFGYDMKLIPAEFISL